MTKARLTRRTALARMAVVAVPFGTGYWLNRTEASLRRIPQPLGRLPADFEPIDGLLMAWDTDLLYQHYDSLAQLAGEAARHTTVMIMTTVGLARQRVVESLNKWNAPMDRIRFANVSVELPWARDFGPLIIKSDQGRLVVVDPQVPNSPMNDSVPEQIADLLGLAYQPMPLAIDGGNVLTNGAGLIITTDRTLELNTREHAKPEYLGRCLHRYLGAEDVVVLQSMQGEPCGHVDMFATFVSRDTILIGEYSYEDDPVNAAILDENARLLANRPTPCGPLRVERIPMPRRIPHPMNGDVRVPEKAEIWFTYTNCVFANGTIIVPSYESVDPDVQGRALDVYRRLLPGWDISTIDSTILLYGNGALRCASMNLIRGAFSMATAAAPSSSF